MKLKLKILSTPNLFRFMEAVRVFITPMVSTLSIMSLAEDGNDAEVLGLGIFVIALNLGMYIVAPAAVISVNHKYIKSRRSRINPSKYRNQ